MSGNVQKTPLARSLPNIGAKRANDLGQTEPKSFPVTVKSVDGHLLTVTINVNGDEVQIPDITIPQTHSQWIREPTQVGDQGMITIPDGYMGGVSGLGGGTADLYPRANLTNAHYQPTSRDAFPAMPDPNAVYLNGPNGVILESTGGACRITLTPSGIQFKVGATTYSFSATTMIVAGADIQTDGGITAGLPGGDSVTLQHHVHPGTLPPTPGT